MQIDPNQPPAPSRDPAAVRADAKKNRTPVAAIVVGVLVVLFGLKAVWRDRTERALDSTLADVVAEQQARLPTDLGNGFTITAARMEADDVVYTLQADAESREALRNPTLAAQFRADELQAMRGAACAPLEPFLAQGTVVIRRIVAADGTALFDVRLDQAACRG